MGDRNHNHARFNTPTSVVAGFGTTALHHCDAAIANLEAQLEDPALSAAKRYALKKDLAKNRADRIRYLRTAKSQT